MLKVDRLSAWYGAAQAVREVTLKVAAGEVVTLVGRNGAGKSTVLRCLMGLHRQVTGAVSLSGTDLLRLPPHRRARLGLGWVPDDRGIYSTLSVAENLTLPPVTRAGGWSTEQLYEAFPALYRRRSAAGSTLSGGEQQMLAIARVLRTGARLLLCDEPTEGLSPLLVQQVGEVLSEVRRRGGTVLLVEQNVHFAATVADRHYLLAQGRVVEAMDNAEVRDREHELLEYLGI